MNLKPTTEQQAAINLFRQGCDLKINAFAGTGKTSTLVMLANNGQQNKRGLYVAFNRSIIDEAKRKFPRNIICKTINSLAIDYLKSIRELNLKTKIFTPKNLTKKHIQTFFTTIETFHYYSCYVNGDIYLSPDNLHDLIYKTITNYFYSDAKEITPFHVQHLPVMNDVEQLEQTCFLKIHITNLAKEFLSFAFDPSTSTPLGFQGSVKYWSLMNPSLPYDFILLDEAQDTDPIFTRILINQNCQKIIVGDKYQQIYSWRGAINAMDSFNIDDEIFLTQSFRFGNNIAHHASAILELLNEKKRLIGSNVLKTQSTALLPPNAYLCRTNAGIIETVLELLNNGIYPQVPKNIRELLTIIKSLQDVLEGRSAKHPMFIGISSMEQLQKIANQDSTSELNIYLRLLHKFGAKNLSSALNSLNNGQNGPEVTTIHKAKGKEWDHVVLHDDFPIPPQVDSTYQLSIEILNLLYVAITRARYNLFFNYNIGTYFNIVSNHSKFTLSKLVKTKSCDEHCSQCSRMSFEIASITENNNYLPNI